MTIQTTFLGDDINGKIILYKILSLVNEQEKSVYITDYSENGTNKFINVK